jgi:response regulator RpfG family c-di-GMP phosphodiesterase
MPSAELLKFEWAGRQRYKAGNVNAIFSSPAQNFLMALANILWVDDEIESLQSQKKFLENKGYDCSNPYNGYDAVDFVKANQVDVVLLDETMPGSTGIETLSRSKR